MEDLAAARKTILERDDVIAQMRIELHDVERLRTLNESLRVELTQTKKEVLHNLINKTIQNYEK